VHFHAFMADVHARVHAWRQLHREGKVKGDDPVAPVAQALAEEAALLCFDEFIVNDIADAMILGRLFEAMFARGLVVVATSNVAPQDLYRDGLNRALFLPFIALLEQRMETIRLDARTDFRLEKLAGAPVYHVPDDARAKAALDKAFAALVGAETPVPQTLTVLGHDLPVPLAAGGVARFSFSGLCRTPLGASDFLEIARQFHCVIIDGIEVMNPAERNIVRRFITLIDALYDHAVKLVASAEAAPAALYVNGLGREAVEFERTASRLIEMQSQQYMALPHGRKADEPRKGVVET
jgi:cell division protein ZapE